MIYTKDSQGDVIGFDGFDCMEEKHIMGSTISKRHFLIKWKL